MQFDDEGDTGGVPQATYKLLVDRMAELEQQQELQRKEDLALINQQQQQIQALITDTSRQAQALEVLQQHIQHQADRQQHEWATLGSQLEKVRASHDKIQAAQVADRQRSEQLAQELQQQVATNLEEQHTSEQRMVHQITAAIEVETYHYQQVSSALTKLTGTQDTLATQLEASRNELTTHLGAQGARQQTLENSFTQHAVQLEELHTALERQGGRQQTLEDNLARLERQGKGHMQIIQQHDEALLSTATLLTQELTRISDQIQTLQHRMQDLEEHPSEQQHQAATTMQQLDILQKEQQQLSTRLLAQQPSAAAPTKPKRPRKRSTTAAPRHPGTINTYRWNISCWR